MKNVMLPSGVLVLVLACGSGQTDPVTSTTSALDWDSDIDHDDVDAHGNILVSDQFNNRVIEIEQSGKIVWSFGLGPMTLARARRSA
jgi:hypothetical protein